MWRLTPSEDKPFAEALPGITGQHPGSARDQSLFLRLLAKSPAATKAYLQTEAALRNGQLTAPQREKISLAVAEINGSNSCLAVHELAGRQAGLSDEEVALARKARAKDPQTSAMLHFVQAIVLQRGEISDQDFSAVRHAGFSDSLVIEILANVGLNIFTNYFNLLAQTDLNHEAAQI